MENNNPKGYLEEACEEVERLRAALAAEEWKKVYGEEIEHLRKCLDSAREKWTAAERERDEAREHLRLEIVQHNAVSARVRELEAQLAWYRSNFCDKHRDFYGASSGPCVACRALLPGEGKRHGPSGVSEAIPCAKIGRDCPGHAIGGTYAHPGGCQPADAGEGGR